MTLPTKNPVSSVANDTDDTALLPFPNPYVPDRVDLGIDNPLFINDVPEEILGDSKKTFVQRNDSFSEDDAKFLYLQKKAVPPLYPSEAWISPKDQLSSTNNSDNDFFSKDKRNSVNEKIQELAKAFSDRTQNFKEVVTKPVSSDESESELEDDDEEEKNDNNDILDKLDTLFAKTPDISRPNTPFHKTSLFRFCKRRFQKCIKKLKRPIDPQGTTALVWQFLVTISFLYNSWGITLRAVFPYQTSDNVLKWLIADYIADGMYFFDMIWFRMRSRMLVRGFWMTDFRSIRKAYVHSKIFLLDLFSLLPLDLLYLKFGVMPLLRIFRLLKVHVFWDFFSNWDRVAHSPYFVREVRTSMYMLYMIHLNACAYYAFSNYQGLGSNSWTYDGKGNAYVRCFLFALKTAVSIGKNPKPTEESEYVFMTISWLLGVFIFAILIGQIKDIMNTAAQNKTRYQRTVDRVQAYLQRLHLPDELQERIHSWFDHMWEENKGIDERIVMTYLPKNMRSDLALYIHFHSLNKVELFKGLERDLLRELVLKLQQVLYLPGDYICKKGEVGKEMYIVNDGYIQVMGGENNDKVLVTLGEGSVFGEISLLAIGDCGNRRTADVRAKGFAELFILDKTCLYETVQEFPEAQAILQRKAKKLIKKKAKPKDKTPEKQKEDIVIVKNRPETPRLVQTVLQVLPESSATGEYLRRGSQKSNLSIQAFDN